MTFLEKFKGKTQLLTRQDVSGILGGTSSQSYQSPQKIINKQIDINLPKSKQSTKNSKKIEKIAQGQQPHRIIRQNPFCVSNPLYLEQEERQRQQKLKKERQIKERIQRQRKHKMLLQAKLAESDKKKKKISQQKQWKPLGGLGPNIGGDEWLQKRNMQQKMLKFAEQIKQINSEKLKKSHFSNHSNVCKNSQDSRTRAIEYSLCIPRPKLQLKEQSVNPKMKFQQQESDLQYLQIQHQKFKKMLRNL